MKKWMCWNKRCWTDPNGKPGFAFESDTPICPKCKVDTSQARFRHLVSPCRTIHYEPPHPDVDGMGTGFIACNPAMSVHDLERHYAQASGEPIAVNCEACKASADWPKESIEMDPSRVPLIVPHPYPG